MDKQEQINEMIEAFKSAIGDNALIDIEAEECTLDCNGVDHAAEQCAKALYNAGYRKQSGVAKEIIEMLKAAKSVVRVHFEAYDELIENIAAEYGGREVKQTTVTTYEDMPTDEFIELLKRLKGSMTSIEDVVVNKRDYYADGHRVASEHYFTVTVTEDKQ